MKLFRHILYLVMFLVAVSCHREENVDPAGSRVPDGQPVTMNIGFGAPSMLKVDIGTKAEANRADESYVHDLYVMIFDEDGNRFYDRYFTYEHKTAQLSDLEANPNEGWWADNSEYDSENQVYTTTRGVVKISTVSRQNCTLVVLANISNSISTLDGQSDALDCLTQITTLDLLSRVKVTLRQEIVNRTDLFLMLGMTGATVDTGSSVWGHIDDGGDPVYDGTKVQLNTMEAKVKFYVSFDAADDGTAYINSEASQFNHWQVYNVPSSAYLVPQAQDPDNVNYFSTEEAYFEGVHRDENDKLWSVFSFYMLENRQSSKRRASIEALATPNYYFRELQDKSPDAVHSTPEESFVVNGAWTYAPAKATYVKFDTVLAFTQDGIESLGGTGYDKNALSAEVRYTVHLGNFASSKGVSHNFDNYDVARGHAYSYYITIQNAESVYIEVAGENGNPNNIREDEPGQEGSLMLATTDLVNCDAHYEYHCMTFYYDQDLDPSLLSWYVKTPFGEGAAHYDDRENEWVSTFKDDKWVMISLNNVVGGDYSELRQAYPGIGAYDPSWTPATPGARPLLMDIRQLVSYIFDQTQKKNAGEDNDFVGVGADAKIRVTAFVDEYYYESDPLLGTGKPEPDLWRKFVNAKPRELHILSKARFSEDRQSTLVTSSHAIIQQSIQSFYNVYSPLLSSLWGTEHRDEMSYANRVKKNPDEASYVWSWWPSGRALPSGGDTKDEENGRVNTATLWGLNSGMPQHWADANDDSYTGYLYYNVLNVVPELKDDNKYMAYSCLTRNRDNNGNGVIDPEELRWYTASVNQLIGMWVGSESLSKAVRLYQPLDASNKTDGLQWRSWVVSSTASKNGFADPVVIRAEETATRSNYNFFDWAGFNATQRDMVSSVRCVRNVGTYQDGGETKDVTRAPYDFMVDQYYDFPAGADVNGNVLPNEDGTYTIRFTNLNPKSIREYTETDLPYHDESSAHNQVYLELHIQSRESAQDGGNFGDEEVINRNITRLGYNDYCPEGYRLPSMTELLVMRALQPSGYWRGNTVYPCRTYFSRGKLGENQTDTEIKKVGWGYTSTEDRLHLLDAGTALTGIRCVRDRNRTGDITGKVTVDGGERLVAGTPATVNLNFTSMGSAITDVSLALIYVDANGLESARPITISPAPEMGSTSVRAEGSWNVPSVPILGRMSVRATVRNAAGVVRVFETPVKLLSEVFTTVRLLHCEYSETLENPAFPVQLTASSPSADRPLKRVTLIIMAPNGDIQKIEYPVTGDKHYLSKIHFFTYTPQSLQTGMYTFQVEAVTSDVDGYDEVATRSSVASMQILQHDYWPNPVDPDVEWNTAEDVTGLWDKQKVTDLNFGGGDFIEANMDVTNCYYEEVMENGVRNDNKTLGKDCLISVGLTDTDYNSTIKVPYVFHVYYPAHDGNATSGKDWLRPNFTNANASGYGINYTAFHGGAGTGFEVQSGNQFKLLISAMQHFRMDNEGMWWNNQKMDLSKWNSTASVVSSCFDVLRSSSTLYIGSTQGLHHSRAGYMFVRVVHNSAKENAAGGGVNLGDGPVDGGSLY